MQQKKILIIEDKTYIVSLLENILESAGYMVKSARNRQDGLIQLNNFNPDLVLLDLELKDVNIFEICREIKFKFKKSIIILTPNNEHNTKTYTGDSINTSLNTNKLLNKIDAFFGTTYIKGNQKNQHPVNSSINEVSHELKTPLTVIIGFAELISSTQNPSIETYKTAFDNIERESRNLLSATEKFLDIATQRSFC